MTEIKLKSLDQAIIINTLKYNTIEDGYTTWKNLPTLSNTESAEFLGWFTSNTDVAIHNGDVMVLGYTTLYPKWGDHDWKEVYAEEPTCTEAGWNSYKVCKRCGYTTKVEIAALGHSFIFHEKSESTCISDGYKKNVYECTRCNKLFSDNTGSTELDRDDIIIPKSGHKSDGTIYGKDDAENHWYHCIVCDKDYGFEKHQYSDWSEVDEERQSRTCKVCGHTETALKEHMWVKVDEEDSTCTKVGHKAYWKCTKHDGEYSVTEDHETIVNEEQLHELIDLPLKDHTLGSWLSNNDVHFKICEVCKEKFYEGDHDFEYTFISTAERNLVVQRKCIICNRDASIASSSDSAFDITTVFGSINVERIANNTWTLSYNAEAASVYWSDEKGGKIIEGADPFTIQYTSSSSGAFKVYCHILDENKREVDLNIAVLKTN